MLSVRPQLSDTSLPLRDPVPEAIAFHGVTVKQLYHSAMCDTLRMRLEMYVPHPMRGVHQMHMLLEGQLRVARNWQALQRITVDLCAFARHAGTPDC